MLIGESVAEVAQKLAHPYGKQPKKTATGFMTNCPVHKDENASLSIAEKNGKVLAKCQAGCTQQSVFDAIRPYFSSTTRTDKRITATYRYRESDGTLLFEKLRYEPKEFRQRRPDQAGKYIYSLDGIDTTILYRLPEVCQAIVDGETIYIVEGEKDVDNLAHIGLVATTNNGGAGKWKVAHTQQLIGAAALVILPDNDSAGKDHAKSIASTLNHAGIEHKIIELPNLPPKGDVSDWLAMGGTRERYWTWSTSPLLPVSRNSRLKTLKTWGWKKTMRQMYLNYIMRH
jgi:5S rRNA maturation endonuclease (ribonuclease M5)